MKQTKLILVGGFLGAGKTSMLYRAAQLLREEGNRVGLITNDQASNLVDTAILSDAGMPVNEVSGSCFCCNFPGLIEAIESVASAIDGGITIAEPVGSCTDLSATILQPIKDRHRDLADPAPMTVMADPERLRGILDKKYSTAAYIATKQFEEADIILINKADVLKKDDLRDLVRRTQERWPDAKVMTASVKENTGVREWLDEVLRAGTAGSHLAEVDYDLYADGEAAYGWLNATYSFARPVKTHPIETCPEEARQEESSAAGKLSTGAAAEEGKTAEEKACAAAAVRFLDLLESGLSEKNAEIGHVKFLLRAGKKQWLGNLTGMADHKTLREEAFSTADGKEDADEYTLIVNARAETGPGELQEITLAAIDRAFDGFKVTGTQIRTLIPGRPNPTWHYDQVI